MALDSTNIETEGELKWFAEMPAQVKENIWRYFIPAGRVVDIVYCKYEDRFFSFGAIVPAVLHVCQESRRIGLQVYTLCFGTKSHAPSIPFDFSADCLLFDDWLAGVETSTQDLSTTLSCRDNLKSLIGPMGQLEQSSIHRIAFTSDLYKYDRPEDFTSGLKFLYQTFPMLDFLVLVIENERSPYASGVIEFYNSEATDYCCDACFSGLQAWVFGALKRLGTVCKFSHCELFPRRQPKIEVRFRGVYRGGIKQPWRDPSERKTAAKYSHLRDELLRVEEHTELDPYNQERKDNVKQNPDGEIEKFGHDFGSSKEDSKVVKIKVEEEESEKLECVVVSSKKDSKVATIKVEEEESNLMEIERSELDVHDDYEDCWPYGETPVHYTEADELAAELSQLYAEKSYAKACLGIRGIGTELGVDRRAEFAAVVYGQVAESV
jgi:hypothetical protein